MTQALNLEQIRANYLRDLQNQNPAAHVHTGSDNHVQATAIAAVGEGQYQHQEWILRQAFADTADSAYLEKHAAKYGIYRKAATTAGGKLRISGAVGTAVPAGLQISAGAAVYLTAEAAAIGLITEAVPADQLGERVEELARRVIRVPTMAARLTKRAINMGLKRKMVDLMEAHLGLETMSHLSEDHAEAIHAFIEKRKPNFVGR